MRILFLCFVFLTTPTLNAEAASLGTIINDLKKHCGARVVSHYRKTLKPNGQVSCHATGQAVDMSGNYACMYRRLSRTRYGYTLDAGRCRHIHISVCPSEIGRRFNHSVC